MIPHQPFRSIRHLRRLRLGLQKRKMALTSSAIPYIDQTDSRFRVLTATARAPGFGGADVRGMCDLEAFVAGLCSTRPAGGTGGGGFAALVGVGDLYVRIP